MEETLYQSHPTMLRTNPVGVLICVALIPVMGIGLAILICWWLRCMGHTLTVTSERIIYREGILAKAVSEILIADIRNIQVVQTIWQRLMGVGSLAVSSAAQADVEIRIAGIPDPECVREIINQARRPGRSPFGQPSPQRIPVAQPVTQHRLR
jgi:uncharacterized membrane protein YdbT with pleckstrin-like domain